MQGLAARRQRRSLTEQLPDDALCDAVGPGAPEIAAMLPELRRRLPDVEDAPHLDPESERARLFDNIGAFLRNAAEHRPLVIFLDDLHWCDKPSLALLELIARSITDRRIVIVGTYRDVEVDRMHPLAQTLAALRRMEHHERLAIRGLPGEEIDDLLAWIEPSEESRPVRRVLSAVLIRETEGNPLFIWEVVTHLIEAGKIVYEDGRWTSHITNVAELGIPEGLCEAIGRRLTRLSEGCNRMLQRLSALTGGFTWDELSAICQEPEDELLDYLDEALGSQLLEERGKASYAFTHALIRATLYDEMSTPRRVRLHTRVAEAIEALYADNIDAHLDELAAYYMASIGGEAEKAIDYSIRAGKRAIEMVAWEEAAAHYQRALEAMPEEVDEERRCSILLDLGEALVYGGQPAAAVDAYRQAAAAARSVASAELLGEAACGFEEAGYYIQGDPLLPGQRLELIDEALEALGREDSTLRARLLAQRMRPAQAIAGGDDAVRLGGIGSLLGSKDPELLRQAREAVAIAERMGDAAVTALTLDSFAQYTLGPGNEQEQSEICVKLIRVAREGGVGRFEVSGLNFLFNVTLAQGNMIKARELHAETSRRSEELKIGWAIWGNYAREATLTLAEGSLDDAESALFEALNYGQSVNHATALTTFGAQLFLLRFYQGRLAELEAMWKGVVEQSPNFGIYGAALSLLLAETGKVQEARAIFGEMRVSGFAALPEDGTWIGTMLILCDTCARLGDRDAAADLYEVASRHQEGKASMGPAGSLGAITRSLGQLATLLERWDEAERHFQDGLELNEKMGHRPALAQTRVNYGDMLIRRDAPGDREKARPLLQQALDAARAMGMAKLIEDCERLLGECDDTARSQMA